MISQRLPELPVDQSDDTSRRFGCTTVILAIPASMENVSRLRRRWLDVYLACRSPLQFSHRFPNCAYASYLPEPSHIAFDVSRYSKVWMISLRLNPTDLTRT